MTTINMTQERYEQLREAYDEAVANDQEQFNFQGIDMYTPYVKYLLEYLENRYDT